MIIGIGTDIIEVSRIKESIEKYQEKFLSRVFTPTEIEYCNNFNEKKYLHLAARFAAKEAFSKAIGTGIAEGFKLNEFGVLNDAKGKPTAQFFGSFVEKYKDITVSISLSHIVDYATAFVIVEGKEVDILE